MSTDFTPYASLMGGILIGLAATLLMLSIGRIAGMTGILTGVLLPSSLNNWTWRAAFLIGMVAAPIGGAIANIPMQAVEVAVDAFWIAIGGAIVGCGVTLGSGCTSGHGVCGLARFSKRSLVATLSFMITTGFTVYVVRHVIGG